MKKLTKVLVAGALVTTGFSVLAGESAGFVEPGYLNYNYDVSSNELSISDINRLNRVQPSAAGDLGFYEAGYLNYSYTAKPAAKPSDAFNEETLKPFYSNYQ